MTRDDVTDVDESVGRRGADVGRAKPPVRGRRCSEAPPTCVDQSAVSSSSSPVWQSTPSRLTPSTPGNAPAIASADSLTSQDHDVPLDLSLTPASRYDDAADFGVGDVDGIISSNRSRVTSAGSLSSGCASVRSVGIRYSEVFFFQAQCLPCRTVPLISVSLSVFIVAICVHLEVSGKP